MDENYAQITFRITAQRANSLKEYRSNHFL